MESDRQDNTALLSVTNLSCLKSNRQTTFCDVSFEVYAGDILVVSGRSGSGKTTLLKCISHLNLYQGEVLLHGRYVLLIRIPRYRTLVLYVPQRPSLLPATPRDFVTLVSTYSSRLSTKSNIKTSLLRSVSLSSIYSFANANKVKLEAIREPMSIAEEWGIEQELWDRPWSSLSGGETQRIALAVAVGISGAEVLLLDEPTSALDAETTTLVESSLQRLVEDEDSKVKAIIWITHSEEQGRRVGTRYLYLEAGNCLESMEMGLPSSRSSRTPRNSSPIPSPLLVSL
ncbi:P-loop containing nucleoside triphosphate hydrolase protein [Ramaria rubella]|nr:P-loop containing nucleoside triphosphate hydrolase protein [Ramaria rubella]